MSKLKIVILATMIAWAGFESNQTATATQFSARSMTKATHPRNIVTTAQYLSLAKRCTLKRYRRPR